MRRRIYVDGKPAWSENEPDCYARRAGFGGAAIGHFQGTVIVVPRRPKGSATEAERLGHRRGARET